MVGNLGIVENALVRHHPLGLENLVGEDAVAVHHGGVGTLGQVFAVEHLQGGLHRAQVILGQGPGIGPGIGQDLVLFVQGLGQAQGVLGGEAEAAVGFPLQAGEVEEQGRELGGGLGLLAHFAGLAFALGLQGLGPGFVPQAVGPGVFVLVLALEGFVEPLALVFAGSGGEGGLHFPVGTGLEFADLAFPLHHQGEGRGLHPAHGGEVEAAGLGVEGGHGPGAVDADQPVGFGTAHGGIAQPLHFLAAAQTGEAVADGLGRHGLQPQPLHGLAGLSVAGDVIEDQLALAARVTGVHQAVHILALDQLGQQLEAGLGFLHRLQFEVGRDHGQVGKGPLAALDLVFLGDHQFQQMADSRGENEVVALEIVVMLGETAKGFGDVGSDGRFFGNDELFAHGRGLWQSRSGGAGDDKRDLRALASKQPLI